MPRGSVRVPLQRHDRVYFERWTPIEPCPTQKESDITVHELQPSLFTLDAAQAAAIRAAAETITADANLEPDDFNLQAAAASFEVPVEVRNAILNFSNVGSDTGILVIRGLYVDDDLIDTPLDNKGGYAAKTTFAKQQDRKSVV